MYTPNKITALILAGGLGLRLRPVVKKSPKILAPVNGRPFIFFLLDQLVSAGFQHVILCIGYLSSMVEDALGNQYKSLAIHYSPEHEQLGTGGALHNARPLIASESLLVMNGDSYLDIVLSDYVAKFFANEQKPVLLLTRLSDTSRYGRVEVDNDGFIIAFEEKKPNAGAGWINAGIYIFNTLLINSAFGRKPYSIERDFFPNLVGKGLYGFKCTAPFIDIGTPESLANAQYFFAT